MISDIREVITSYFRLQAEASAPPSATGAQLQRLQLGMSGGDDSGIWRAAHSADRKAGIRADLVLMLRDLTPLEREVCRLRYWYVEAGDYDGNTKRGGYERYTRNVRESDTHVMQVGEVQERWRAAGDPVSAVPMAPVKMTLAGEEDVRPASELNTLTLGANPEEAGVDGYRVVKGVRAKLTSYETIAKATQAAEWTFGALTVRQVRTVLRRAHEKVQAHMADIGTGDWECIQP